jgi:hypothetical protein
MLKETPGGRRTQISAPACDKCGGTARLLTAEPHPRFKHTDVRTFQCDACGATQSVAAPLPHG